MRAAVAMLLVGTVLVACGGGASGAPPATRTVDVGSGPVEVPTRPTRIAVLAGGLAAIADVVGAQDRVPALVEAYETRLAEVRGALAPPAGPTAVYLSLPGGKQYLVPPDAAYPGLLRELGFSLDPVLQKADDPRVVSTGDSFEVSPELLARVADAPNLQVLERGGPTAQQLAGDPVFAQLPAFSGGTVTPVPALAYRPDYPAVLLALDALEQAFRR